MKEDNWSLFKRLRNKCSLQVKKDRSSYFSSLNKICTEKGDSASLFKLAKKLMNLKNSGTPTCFSKNGKMVTAPREIANIQLNFYIEKIEKLIQNLPNDHVDPLISLKNALRRWGMEAKKHPKF